MPHDDAHDAPPHGHAHGRDDGHARGDEDHGDGVLRRVHEARRDERGDADVRSGVHGLRERVRRHDEEHELGLDVRRGGPDATGAAQPRSSRTFSHLPAAESTW
ncbi:hypothetical protein GC092_07550 [Microbacterium sp. JZ37]|nr:hypothetical protein GC092_07550 [Microbacterium sp. JZ37]